jgi:hypothetical protein
MEEKITAKALKKQKEKAEKLMAVFGEDYNEWLYKKHEEYIEENSEKALEELFSMREKMNERYSDQDDPDDPLDLDENEDQEEKIISM